MAMPLAILPARGPLGSTEAEANGVEVFIENLEIDAHIGAHAHERGAAQALRIDVRLSVTQPAIDRLDHAVDYAELADAIRGLGCSEHIVLIETFAARVADICLGLSGVLGAAVEVRKPGALHPATAGVSLVRAAGGTSRRERCGH
jgi:dihydroneopterin aldolase